MSMSVTSHEPGKWEITTPKGRKITVEAPYITDMEVKILASLIDKTEDKMEETTTQVAERVLRKLEEEYEVELEIDLKTGKARGRVRRRTPTPPTQEA
jgi:hypothetical protein